MAELNGSYPLVRYYIAMEAPIMPSSWMDSLEKNMVKPSRSKTPRLLAQKLCACGEERWRMFVRVDPTCPSFYIRSRFCYTYHNIYIYNNIYIYILILRI